MDLMAIEGIVRDDVSNQPIAGVEIYIDAVKPPSGMGILSDARRDHVGETLTDQNGNYKLNLKIFKEAVRLEVRVNREQKKSIYADGGSFLDLSALNRNGSNKTDFALSPVALLEIRFRNVNPVSDLDKFYFDWYPSPGSNGSGRGKIQEQNCGTIQPGLASIWTGKDVCGSITVETTAERYTHIEWTVNKNGVANHYRDSVLVKLGMANEYSINY
jgi:hypothetical protein